MSTLNYEEKKQDLLAKQSKLESQLATKQKQLVLVKQKLKALDFEAIFEAAKERHLEIKDVPQLIRENTINKRAGEENHETR